LVTSLFEIEGYQSADIDRYLHERGGNPKFAELLDLAERICASHDEDTRYIRSDIYYARGAEAAVTNAPATAFKYNTAFLALRLEISETSPQGTRDAELAQAYNQAANAYLDRAEYDVTMDYYNKSWDIFRSLWNYTETMATITIANLSTSLWLLGEYDRANELVLENLRAREEAYGVDDTQSFR
jgi:tetratricopeptide (TPR) repeat protein